MNKQTTATILQKKVNSQGNIPTFFDNLIYDLGIKEGFLILEINDKKINDVGQIDNVPLKSISSILFLNKNGQKERILFE